MLQDPSTKHYCPISNPGRASFETTHVKSASCRWSSRAGGMPTRKPHVLLFEKLNSELANSRRLSFLPLTKLSEILNEENLSSLLKDWLTRKQKKQQAEILQDILAYRRRILGSILLRQREENLKCFFSWYDGFNGSLTDKPSDDDLPLSPREAKAHLHPGFIEEFCDDQLKVCAVVFEQGAKYDYSTSFFDDHRLPILDGKHLLGDGASGKVYAVRIPAGHYVDRATKRENDKTVTLACKDFGGDTSQISSAARDHAREDRVLSKLDEAAWNHDNLMYKLFSVVQYEGSKDKIVSCQLYYECAHSNLQEALTSAHEPPAIPWRTLRDRCGLVNQMKGLIGAVFFFHAENILHRDIKPDNILVVRTENKYLLKLSDYGFSSEILYPRPTSSTNGYLPASEFQAPEVQEGRKDRVGWWTDLWSLACNLLYVLPYMDNGSDGVNAFIEAKSEDRKDTTYDTFYEFKGESMVIVPGVVKSCQRLMESFASKSPREGEIIGKLLDFLETQMLVDEATRKAIKREIRALKAMMDEIADDYKNFLDEQTEPPPSSPSSTAARPSLRSVPSNDTRRESNTSGRSGSVTTTASTASSQDYRDVFEPLSSRAERPRPPRCIPLCKAITAEDAAQFTRRLHRAQSPSEECPKHKTTTLHRVIWMVADMRALQEDMLANLFKHGSNIDLWKKDVLNNRTPLALAGTEGRVKACEQLMQYMNSCSLSIVNEDFLPAEYTGTDNRADIVSLIERYRGYT